MGSFTSSLWSHPAFERFGGPRGKSGGREVVFARLRPCCRSRCSGSAQSSEPRPCCASGKRGLGGRWPPMWVGRPLDYPYKRAIWSRSGAPTFQRIGNEVGVIADDVTGANPFGAPPYPWAYVSFGPFPH